MNVVNLRINEPNDIQELSEERAPIPSAQSNIEKITITHSSGNHIGTRIYAQTVNYIRNTEKRKRSTVVLFLILTSLVVICVVILILVCTIPAHESVPYVTASPSTTTESIPAISTTEHVTTKRSTITPSPPQVTFIRHSEWSIKTLGKCFEITKILSVALDALPDCSEKSSCINFLRGLESVNQSLTHSFFISRDGVIFEGWGWKCAPEYHIDFSKHLIRLAILGSEMEIGHTMAIEILLGQLQDDYDLIPECCRGIPQHKGPGTKIIQTFKKHERFKNKNCPNKNILCK